MTVIRCPACDKPFESEKSLAMPFCCQRCRQVDLYGWLAERHGMPVERDAEGEEEEYS